MKQRPSAGVQESSGSAKRAPAGGEELAGLVRGFMAGDDAAFEELVRRLTPRLHALALRMLGSEEAASEAVQDAWVRMYNRIGDLNDPEAFEGWATRVTLSRVNDEFRSRARERAAREGLAELRRAAGTPREAISRSEREELARVLREAISHLDEPHREVFVLRELEGLSHSDIARTLDIPEGTVWSRLSYARRMLREHLNRRRDDVT